MNQIGEVIAIIDENHLLIRSTTYLPVDDELLVVKKVPMPGLKDTTGLDFVTFPKGHIRVLL